MSACNHTSAVKASQASRVEEMEPRLRTTSTASSGLLGRQLASIKNVLTKASQTSDVQKSQKPPGLLSQTMFTPNVGADSTTDVSRNSGSDISQDELEEMYSRLVRDRNVERENSKTACTTSETQTLQVSLRGGRDVDLNDDTKAMLASMDRAQFTPPPGSTDEEGDDGNEDSRRMLSETEENVARPTQEQIEKDPRLMLAELDQERSPSRGNLSGDEHDLDKLRRRLRELSLSTRSESNEATAPDVMVLVSTRPNTTGSTTDEAAPGLSRQCIAHAVALILETADCGWEVARGWTTYLYSSGLDAYPAQAAKDALVKRATHELNDIIQNVLEVEKEHLLAEERERLPCRLIISNLAAGAEEEDVLLFFRTFAHDIRDMKFLGVRDPIKRTKKVQLDMWTRSAAVRASCMHGSIFGLILDIEVAVSTEK